MDSRPVNHVSSSSPRYMPPKRDAKQDKKKEKTEDKKKNVAEPTSKSPNPFPDDLGSQVDTIA